jgi:hypothetical protein
MMEEPKNVSLGFIHGGTVRVEFMVSVMNVIANPFINNMSNSSAGPLIALARNNLVARFLERGQEDWLWCLDTDIVFSQDCINQLMAVADPVNKPIVSALYYTIMNGRRAVTIYDENPEFPETFDSPIDYPDSEVVKVDGTGAGCLLIHRSVLEKIYEDNDKEQCWFREMVINKKVIGEDLSFAVRARRSGFPIYVHTGVQVGHIKSIMFGEVT